MDENFLEAFIHRPGHIVLGAPLHPFCWNDLILLHAIESPLIEGKVPDLIQLQQAVLVCSTPFEKVQERLASPDKRWLKKCLKMNLSDEIQKFDAYLRDYCAFPTLWQKLNSDSPKIKTPFLLALAASVSRHANTSLAEIRAMPIGELLWWQVALAEQEGADVDLITPEEEQAIQEAGHVGS
ncbi:MAG: hypothetical protein V1746_03780 [bacterium]